METVQVEVWVMVDEAGNYVCHTDRGCLKEQYEEEIGEWTAEAVRVLKLTVAVPAPRPVELSAVIAAEPAVGELKSV